MSGFVTLVFFGAGASKPFGIPTMQEMVSKFEKEIKLENTELYDFYLEIKNTLAEEYEESRVDIESILSVINGISTNTSPVQLGPFAFYYMSKNNVIDEFTTKDRELAKKLEEKLHNCIRDACNVKKRGFDLKDIYEKSYLPLFKYMVSPHNDAVCMDWKAYTTNYDNIFEWFCDAHRPPEDHFEQIGESNRYSFEKNPLRDEVTLSKLHGSLDWTREAESGSIIRINPDSYNPVPTEGDVMLFPIQQKDLYLHPWFTLFQDLKAGLEDKKIWYVVGYAFNDEFIRNTFQESLANDNSKRLTVIDPNANEIRDKFSEDVREQIYVLPISFGDKYFETQLKDHVSGIKTIIIRFDVSNSPQNHKIEVRSNLPMQSPKIQNENEVGFTANSRSIQGQVQHVFFEPTQKNKREVRLEIPIEFRYGDEVELHISDTARALNFSIDYGGEVTVRSQDLSDEYADTPYSDCLKDPIKLGNDNLYINKNFIRAVWDPKSSIPP